MCILPLNMIQCLSEECKECMSNAPLLSFKVCAWGKFLKDNRWMSLLRNCCLCSQLCNFQADRLSTRRRNKCIVLKTWTFFFVSLYNYLLFFFFPPIWKWTYSISVATSECKCNFSESPLGHFCLPPLSRIYIFFNGVNKIDSWNISSNCIVSHFCV